MNKSVTKFIKTVKRGFGKRSPEILLGIGIASGITTTILAVKATPKALQLIEDAKFEKATTWNEEHQDGLLEISYGAMVANDGRPCITLEYHVAPRYDFAKLM